MIFTAIRLITSNSPDQPGTSPLTICGCWCENIIIGEVSSSANADLKPANVQAYRSRKEDFRVIASVPELQTVVAPLHAFIWFASRKKFTGSDPMEGTDSPKVFLNDDTRSWHLQTVPWWCKHQSQWYPVSLANEPQSRFVFRLISGIQRM